MGTNELNGSDNGVIYNQICAQTYVVFLQISDHEAENGRGSVFTQPFEAMNR